LSDRAIRTIAVAGGGIVGLSAALAFARSLPRTTVTLIETPPDPAAIAERIPVTWPTVHRFHSLIGIDERDLIGNGIATHHVGTVLEAPRGNWVHAFAPHGSPAGAVHFDQVWVRAQREGSARTYDSYSAGAALARANKFAQPPGNSDRRFDYGLRLDPHLYRNLLREQAAGAKANIVTGVVEEVEREPDGRVSSIRLSTGDRIEADLFIDSTGPAGRLISEVDDSFEPWSGHPMHHLCINEVETGELATAARIAFLDGGWAGEWPLRGRSLRCIARRDSDGPNAIAIRPGSRARPWVYNVLALGEAAAAFDPLHGLNLDLAQRAILLAVDLLPGRDCNPLELAEYNRRFALMADQVRDFLALHYQALEGIADVPDSLARRIDQYWYRGRLPFQEDEILNRDDWTAALIGLGFVPCNVDPAAAGVPLDRATDAMDRMAVEFDSATARLPDYADFLERLGSGR
jgi:tryptophan 7-halogenase